MDNSGEGMTRLAGARFGNYEVNFEAGELRKHGLPIKIQEKPLRLLQTLMERPGEIVTREELRARVWPSDVYVDFDSNLKIALNKLRTALCDSADSPRYIETLPRRGYRFIAAVDRTQGNGSASSESQLAASADAAVAPVLIQPAEPPLAAPRKKALGRWLTAVATAVVAIAFVALWLGRTPAAPTVTRIVQLTRDGLAKGDALVTDGSRIYFSEGIAEHWRPVVISTEGGEPRPIAMPFEDANVLDISPNGAELLISTVGEAAQAEPLWALPVLGGSPRRIGEITANEATWSPDGREILYLKGFKNSLDLYVANSDGTGSHKLVTAPGDPYFVRWSPDGRSITLSVDDGKSNTLWEVSADGSNLHPVLPGWNRGGASSAGRWTPDGRYFLFDFSRDGADGIWSLSESGGLLTRRSHDPVPLTSGPMAMSRPLPGKDGKTIFAFGSLPHGELVRYDTQSRQFVAYLGGISAEYLDVSPDGQWLAYVTYPEHTLWKMKADGSQRVQLTFAPFSVFLPRWSPDGKRIAFSDLRAVSSWWGHSSILSVPADGGNPEPLELGPRPVADVGWFPDGKSVVFGYQASPSDPSSIQVYNLETRQISKVPGSDGIFSPRLSLDGRFILGITWDDQNVMLFDLRTQKWSRVASGGVGWLMWSHDGRYAYFDNGKRGSDAAVFRARLADRAVERFLSLKDFKFPPSLDCYWGLAPDDSIILLRDIASREIYALDWQAP